MPSGIFIQLEVDFDEDEAIARLARYTKPGEARACRDLLVSMWRYCRRKMTDGHVPAEMVGKLVYPDSAKRGERDADRLVECGLAERTDTGFYLPGYLKHNPSKAQVEARQDALAVSGSESGSFGNHVRWHVKKGKTSRSCEHCQRRDPVAIPSGTDRVDLIGSDRVGSHIDIDRGRDRDKRTTQGGDRYETLPATDATGPPTCSKHPDGDSDQPCAGCQRVRQWREDLKASIKADAAERRRNCTRCGGGGWIETDDGTPAVKCNHLTVINTRKDDR